MPCNSINSTISWILPLLKNTYSDSPLTLQRANSGCMPTLLLWFMTHLIAQNPPDIRSLTLEAWHQWHIESCHHNLSQCLWSSISARSSHLSTLIASSSNLRGMLCWVLIGMLEAVSDARCSHTVSCKYWNIGYQLYVIMGRCQERVVTIFVSSSDVCMEESCMQAHQNSDMKTLLWIK